MESEILSKVLESLDTALIVSGEDKVKFRDKRYTAVALDVNNFKEIKKMDNQGRKIAFIDGGNLEILKAANFSLQLIRIYCCIYLNNKRVKAERFQFYVLVNSFDKEGSIHYRAQLFGYGGINPDDLVFDSYDETLIEGKNQASISRIGEVARKFAETKTAEKAVAELSEGDIIVKDGTLQCTVTNEANYFSALYEAAKKKKVVVAGLAKTSTLLTEKGNSLAMVLNGLNNDKFQAWLYHPVVSINSAEHQAELLMVKLHEKSKYIFRLELFKGIPFDAASVVSLLAENAKDGIFLGYPYGLIEADKFARVSKNEAEYLRTGFMAKAGKKWQKIEKYLTTANAHDILDRIG